MPMWLFQTETVPFLTISAANAPLEWDVGLFYKARLQYASLHLANNAIVASNKGRTRDLLHDGWRSVTCTAARSALCRHDETLDFFDTKHSTIPYVYSADLSRTYMPPVCTTRMFGRVQTSATGTYTASVCDLVEGHVHFVLQSDHGQSTMLFKHDDTALWQVLLLAATAIYAVTMLAVHVSELVKPDAPAVGTRTRTAVYAQLAAHTGFAVALVASCASHHSFLVTDEEVLLSSVLYAFVMADWVFTVVRVWGDYSANDDRSKQVNGMVVMLILVTLRLSSSFQNVFVVVLTMMFGVRTWSKIVQTTYKNMQRVPGMQALLPNLSVTFDVAVLYLLLSIAMAEQCETELETKLLVCTVLFGSFNVGLLIAVVLQVRTSRQN